jgi:hypothetical protein
MMEVIKLYWSSIWGFVLPFVRVMLSQAGPVLAAAALSAVKVVAANASGATNSEKRDLALSAVLHDLENQGIKIGVDVSTSMCNAAIEVALQKLKSL